jgi:nicotinate dehydrogenase subunit B
MSVSRREFIRSTGAVVVYFSLAGCEQSQDVAAKDHATYDNRIRINADGSVELFMGKVELGQGIGTALAQIAADELGVAFDRVRLVTVDTDFSPDEAYTFSSISVQQSGPKVRAAAAKAREYRQQLFGDKPANEPSVVGESIQRLDIPGKVFGEASFIQDLRLDDMVHARVLRPPAERAVIHNMDSAFVATMPGVLRIVRDGNFVGVIAEREGQARAAATALAPLIHWQLPEDLPHSDEVYGWLKTAESRTEEIVARGIVDVSESNSLYQATYRRPYQAHASISPSAAVALFEDSKLTVWSHAQGMYPLRDAIAHTLGLSPEDVRCVHKEASGCFGHNGADDAACDAAALALEMPGRPVRLQWERSDEFLWEPLGPAMQVETQAVLETNGRISSWQYDLWSCPHASRPRGADSAGHLIYAKHKKNPLPEPPPYSIPQPSGGSDRNSVPLYTFENVQVNKHFVTDIPVRGSSLRGLGAYGNIFAIESFMDELAEASTTDPFEFRKRHLDDARGLEVLERLQRETQWQNRPPPGTGSGWGLAFARFKNLSSYLGIVMQLQVDAHSKAIQLIKATAVCDAGLVINPDGLKAQIEGGIIQSSSWTLKEQVPLSNAAREARDWNSYPILRFDEVPEVEVILIDRPDEKSLGVGETAQGPTAAAIANAIFHAAGKRLRTLPFTPDRLS